MKAGNTLKNACGFLSRMRRDEAGNVLAMMAAGLIPLIGVVGGAVDLSRAYMTKTRLQAACDSGVLGGRRAMSTLTYTTAARDRANRLFNFNFRNDAGQVEGLTFTTSGAADGAVSGTATGRLPTVLMQMFGNEEFDLTVTCTANFQVPNIDTMLVLDVTGSMAWCPDGSTSCNGNASSRIAGLRTAVRTFHATLQNAAASSPLTQIRYGFVPYSQTVNGSQLFAAAPNAAQISIDQLADTGQYASRLANFNTATFGPAAVSGTPNVSTVAFRKSGSPNDTPMSHVDCDDYSNNRSVSIDAGPDAGVYSPNPTGHPLYRVNSTSPWTTSVPSNSNYQRLDLARITPDFSATSQGNNPATYQICRRRQTITDFVRPVKYGFTNWIYTNVEYDVSQYRLGTAMPYVSEMNEDNALVDVAGTYTPVGLRLLPDQSQFVQNSTTWNGCLEERDTVAAATFSPIPTGARDLDFISPGNSVETRWRPIISELSWLRNAPANQTENKGANRPSGVSQVDASCPTSVMRNLNPMTTAEINTYTNTLMPVGSTYHDIGMIWGLRLISPNGIFAPRNITASNGGQISRHIIFMTDGELAPTMTAYSSYGFERVHRRIAGGSTNPNQETRHARRFQAMCDAARQQGISVWVVAFGTALSSNLTACADPGRAFAATNSAALNQQFEAIAKSIADLRLTS